ncbi:cytochrome P450 [Actinomycetes bacterium M1A6_2h]
MIDLSQFDTRIMDPDWFTDLSYLDAFKELRAEEPVRWVEDPKYGKDFWFLTRHDHISEYLLDPKRLSNRFDTRIPRSPKRRTPEERHEQLFDVRLSTNDDPVHNLYRRPMNKHFSVPAISKLSGDIERIVDDLIADVGPRGEAEFVGDLANALPMNVIFNMLGIPPEDWELLNVASWQWMSGSDPKYMIDGDDVKTSLHGLQTLIDYCTELAVERRANPRDDFATVIANTPVDGQPMSIHEMKMWFVTMIGGGAETTRNAAAVGMWLFLTNPEQKQMLFEDPSLSKGAVEEVLRWVTPERSRLRVATEDLDFHGKRIRSGDWVVAMLASANRDETVFDNPDAFDITRTPNAHLSLGLGVHLCLGRALARLELDVFFRKMLQTFPDMEPVEEPMWIRDRSVSGFTTLPVRFSAAAAASS